MNRLMRGTTQKTRLRLQYLENLQTTLNKPKDMTDELFKSMIYYQEKAINAAHDNGVMSGTVTRWLHEGKITRKDIELLNEVLKEKVRILTDKQ